MNTFKLLLVFVVAVVFYAQSTDIILQMIKDAQLSLVQQVMVFTIYNALVAHLIVKYIKRQTYLFALLVGCCAVVGVNLIVTSTLAAEPLWFWAYLIVSLVALVYLFILYAAKNPANDESNSDKA